MKYVILLTRTWHDMINFKEYFKRPLSYLHFIYSVVLSYYIENEVFYFLCSSFTSLLKYITWCLFLSINLRIMLGYMATTTAVHTRWNHTRAWCTHYCFEEEATSVKNIWNQVLKNAHACTHTCTRFSTYL